MAKRKTIFIIISRGMIVRNILRSGVLDGLKKRGLRIVILMVSKNNSDNLPEYLYKEFEDKQVVIEIVASRGLGKFYHRFFVPFIRFFVYSEQTWSYSQMGSKDNLKRSQFRIFWDKMFYGYFVSKIKILKKLARFAEYHFFKHNFFAKYFDKYEPDLVFSTSIISKMDIFLMKEARRRGIKTVSMPKGWDNITKILYRFTPDKFIVQNKLMKEAAFKVQAMPKKRIEVAGFPQFDWYAQPDIILPREEFLSSWGINPEHKVIFFGSEGMWTPQDHNIPKLIIEFMEAGKIVEPVSLIIRPHFSDVKKNRFNHLAKYKNVIIDNNYTINNFFSDNWDLKMKNIKQFVNTLYHCDMLITSASTLTLDAACLNKPIINIAFNVLYKDGKDNSLMLYKKDHYNWILSTNAVSLVSNREELLNSINKYLGDPSYLSSERKKLVEKLCYKIDGRASQRIVNVILSLIK